ncbi:hypothetical protein BJP25_01035 [Actinokineospora bangkokensis]|uniref:Protein DA1-like domain-containing protein n=1 Tax=Actinokineospora bangkokensis TaxID=1193682 RepID=A0A1Q9LHD3_9PSEU|nr:hypothetical protein BJP25_01035 [Actinokineospora bangkokensis]
MRADMAALGITLTRRVRVTLVDTIEHGAGSATLGLTHHIENTTDVLGIDVLGGLTGTHFGRVLAHEIGHAWLVQQGAPVRDLVLVEGTCELFAAAWLKKQRTPLATALRTAMATNQHPTYGTGYRLVRGAVAQHGIRAVLAELCATGVLP